MSFIQVNPDTCTKETLRIQIVGVLTTFCNLNNIKIPSITIEDIRKYGEYNYHKKELIISTHTKMPVKVPGYSWSFPGYKADLTLVGVVAHEFGHYLQDILHVNLRNFKESIRNESNVTSYEPTPGESFAEAVKLFLTNPSLLKHGRPLRFDYIHKTLGLKYTSRLKWNVVLQHAHPKFRIAAKNWITK
jgi:hypothetical protein